MTNKLADKYRNQSQEYFSLKVKENEEALSLKAKKIIDNILQEIDKKSKCGYTEHEHWIPYKFDYVDRVVSILLDEGFKVRLCKKINITDYWYVIEIYW
jgi:hypothetical protein